MLDTLKDVDDTVKLARTLSVQSDQLQTAISDKRRALFTQQLFTQSASILSPSLWSDVALNFTHDVRALGIVARDTIERAVVLATTAHVPATVLPDSVLHPGGVRIRRDARGPGVFGRARGSLVGDRSALERAGARRGGGRSARAHRVPRAERGGMQRVLLLRCGSRGVHAARGRGRWLRRGAGARRAL